MARGSPGRLVVLAATVVVWVFTLAGCETAGHYHSPPGSDTGLPVGTGRGVQGSIGRPACGESRNTTACAQLLFFDQIADDTTDYYQLKKRDLGAETPDGRLTYSGLFWDGGDQIVGTDGDVNHLMEGHGYVRGREQTHGSVRTVNYQGQGTVAGVTATFTYVYRTNGPTGAGVEVGILAYATP
jgi:hypothetical protein